MLALNNLRERGMYVKNNEWSYGRLLKNFQS